MVATAGVVYALLGGPTWPVELPALAGPLVGAIATYFIVNTGLVAARSHRHRIAACGGVWRDDFSLERCELHGRRDARARCRSGDRRGDHFWTAMLLVAPVYLTYRTYQVFIGRLEDRDGTPSRRAGCIKKRRMRSGMRNRRNRRWPRRRTDWRRPSPNDAARGWAQACCSIVSRRPGRQRRGRQPAEGSVPGDGVARAAHAAQRHPRLGGHVAHAASSTKRGAIARSRSIFENAQAAGTDDRRAARRRAHHVRQASRSSASAVDLDQVVRAAVEVVQPAAEAKRVAIVVRRSMQQSAASMATASRLQQIVWNLLSNAVKFTEEGGAGPGAASPRARHRARSPSPTAGIGHPAAISCRRVFEPFRQADASSDASSRRTRAGPLDRQASRRGARRDRHSVERRAKAKARPSPSACRSGVTASTG